MENNWYLQHLPQANSSTLCTASGWTAKISNAYITTSTLNHHFHTISTKSPLLQNHHFYNMVQTGCESEQKTLWFPAGGRWPLSPSRTKELSSHTGHEVKGHQWTPTSPTSDLSNSCSEGKLHFPSQASPARAALSIFFFLLLNSCRCGPEFCKSKTEGANIPVPFLIHPFEMLKCH